MRQPVAHCLLHVKWVPPKEPSSSFVGGILIKEVNIVSYQPVWPVCTGFFIAPKRYEA
ncbi:hypothetical protein SLEP1_g31520 [Rubroshorea leprosula]|uniref:Uncharacterized protein n=1 Tax=Rubroshorea leprosula TaxID=152421 RepID=A0AAV5KB90_9ROSI|nr:hypothetical protein SLEP1_g31520 [Rubroshorea leprosula]